MGKNAAKRVSNLLHGSSVSSVFGRSGIVDAFALTALLAFLMSGFFGVAVLQAASFEEHRSPRYSTLYFEDGENGGEPAGEGGESVESAPVEQPQEETLETPETVETLETLETQPQENEDPETLFAALALQL